VKAGVCHRCGRRDRIVGGSCCRRRAFGTGRDRGVLTGPHRGETLRALDRVYPRDLHAILQLRWNSAPLFDGFPSVELPPKAVLDDLLDVYLQASVLTEDGRPTLFRVAYIPSAAPVTANRAELPPVMAKKR
jgi:hypothetical protein